MSAIYCYNWMATGRCNRFQAYWTFGKFTFVWLELLWLWRAFVIWRSKIRTFHHTPKFQFLTVKPEFIPFSFIFWHFSSHSSPKSTKLLRKYKLNTVFKFFNVNILQQLSVNCTALIISWWFDINCMCVCTHSSSAFFSVFDEEIDHISQMILIRKCISKTIHWFIGIYILQRMY